MLAFGAYSSEAAACGACLCNDAGSQPLITLIRDVPVNLVMPLRVVDDAEEPPILERASDGMQVAATAARVEGQPYWMLRVAQDLEPSTEYRIVREAGVEQQFTTGSAPDTSAPLLDSVTVNPGGTGAECDTFTGARLAFAGVSDGDRLDVWVEVEVDVMSTAQPLYGRYDFAELAFGHSEMGCVGDNETPWVEDGAQYPTRVRLHDLGGNTSEWQNLIVTIASTEPAGCGGPGVDPNVGGSGGSAPMLFAGASGTGADPNSDPSVDPNADPSDEGDGHTPRTSKGCGCSVPGDSGTSSLGAALLAAVLLARRRRVRAL